MPSWLDVFEDTDLPILSSLVGSLRRDGTPSIQDGWEAGNASTGVAPQAVPLDSLQSLPVASRML
jgi:hypothetical protein